MSNSIYLDNGYVDMGRIISNRYPWCIVWGGRGTGKTYGTLQYLYDHSIPFAYMRRTQVQADMVSRPELSPYRDIMLDREDVRVTVAPIAKGVAGFFRAQSADGGLDKLRPEGDPIGITLALSTVASIRGFSGRWIQCLVYDEFIPEAHERPLRAEWAAILNAYETINRNRELDGAPPLKMVMLSNSNEINNPVFEGLDIVKRVRQMRRRQQEVCTLDTRGLALYGLDQSPISARKAQTALYRLAMGDRYSQMAINNEYASDTGSRIESRSLSEYAPRVAVERLCLYQHKRTGEWYACRHRSGSPVVYHDSPSDIRRFRTAWGELWDDYLRNFMVFEDDTSEHLFRKLFMG